MPWAPFRFLGPARPTGKSHRVSENLYSALAQETLVLTSFYLTVPAVCFGQLSTWSPAKSQRLVAVLVPKLAA